MDYRRIKQVIKLPLRSRIVILATIGQRVTSTTLVLLLTASPALAQPGDTAKVQARPVDPQRAAPSTRPAEDWTPLYGTQADAAFYPRAAELADGTILATFDHSVVGGKAISCLHSNDGGRTWGDYRRIVEHTGRVDVSNAFPVQLADGTILVAYRHHTLDKRTFRIEVHSSSDNGKQWRFRGTIATGTVGLWEPYLFVRSNGVIQAYYASEEGIYPDQRIEMKSSSDGGATWGAAVTAARKAGSRDGMPSVVRANDGSLLACFEASDKPPFRFVVRTVRSIDDGATWAAQRELVYQPANPAEQRWAAGAPYLVRLKNGLLLASFQTDEDVRYMVGDTQADPGQMGYRYERHTSVKCLMSRDNGVSWARAYTIAGELGNSATWGSLCELRNGNVLMLTTWRNGIWCKVVGEMAITAGTWPARIQMGMRDGVAP